MYSLSRRIRRLVGNLRGTKKVIFFLVITLICVVALCLGIYAQFFYKYSDTDVLMIGINIGSQKTAEEIEALKSNFNSLFDESLSINSENVNVDKIELAKPLVFTAYSLTNEDENYYSVNAHIPCINIDSEKAKAVNAEIKTEFYDKANTVMRRSEGNTVYSVTYVSYINGDVLSLVVKSSLKEKDKNEKITVKTYNYSMSQQRLLSLSDLISLKEKEVEEVQKTINEDIKKAYTNAKIIAAEYGNLFERDLNSDIYKVENTSTFFLTQDGYVYIIYAYGNNDYTNELDVVIF